jgi:hypothetical protein
MKVIIFKYGNTRVSGNLKISFMSKTLFLFIFTITSTICFSQSTINNDSLVVFEKTEIEPSFPGGNSAWVEFLRKNLDMNITEKNKAPVGVYKVIIRFIINQDGSISDIVAETKFGFGMEQEVKRVIGLSPNWNPATQNGHIVRTYRRIPFTFGVK